ncbi:MAG: response regulator [Sphingobacteriales bacterium]|nr:MAG: response regulator [Sphingobacteriales bacterium]
MRQGTDYQTQIKESLLKALIIDDETDICYLLSTLLKQRHLDADYVNTLSDAAVALKKEVPEIIFLDNHLPDGLGMNFISYVKQHYPNIKIVMITAHDTAADRQKAMSVGADFFIGKPFTRDLIYNTVDQLMN